MSFFLHKDWDRSRWSMVRKRGITAFVPLGVRRTCGGPGGCLELLAEPSVTENVVALYLIKCQVRPLTSGKLANRRPAKHFAGVVMRRRFQRLGRTRGAASSVA
jgi:hypothetical protein